MTDRVRLPRVLISGAALAAILVGLPPAASLFAHPLGNFTVNRFSRIEIEPNALLLLHVLDIAEIPSVQEQQAADSDRNGGVSDAEWSEWRLRMAQDVLRGFDLTIDGRPAALALLDSQVSAQLGQANLPVTRFEASFRAAWSGAGEHRVRFRDRNDPGRIGWREIVVRAGPDVTLGPASVGAESISDELRAYPDNLLQSPLDQRQAEWTFTTADSPSTIGGFALPVPLTETGARGRAGDPFTALITAAELSPGVVVLALLAAAVLGGMHGASPGHGKTVMAAYIVGTRGRFVHALALAGSVTFAHTFGVLALGAVILFASNRIVPEQLYPWLTLASGVIVFILGVGLLVRAAHGLAARHLSSQRDHARDHSHGHDHEHGDGPGQHRHDLPITWRNLFALGLAGGMVPSASALVVLLSALALGRLGFGLLLIVAFGAGMGIVLTAAGVLMVFAGRLVARLLPEGSSPIQARLTRAVPPLSALVMTLVGLVVIVQALGQFGYLSIA